MPVRDRERINRALNEVKSDPLSGDITALRGDYQGLYRRRVGAWRIIFALKPDQRVVLIGDIARRYFNHILRLNSKCRSPTNHSSGPIDAPSVICPTRKRRLGAASSPATRPKSPPRSVSTVG
jgi:mRNA-degrading endonuclease RelE of RelBE toxin-antitoxin system